MINWDIIIYIKTNYGYWNNLSNQIGISSQWSIGIFQGMNHWLGWIPHLWPRTRKVRLMRVPAIPPWGLRAEKNPWDFSKANRLKPWGFLPWNIVESGVPSRFRSQNSIRFWLRKNWRYQSSFQASLNNRYVNSVGEKNESIWYRISYNIYVYNVYIYIYIYRA